MGLKLLLQVWFDELMNGRVKNLALTLDAIAKFVLLFQIFCHHVRNEVNLRHGIGYHVVQI